MNKSERNAFIRASLRGLPFDEQHLLESKLGDQLSFEQIADFLTDVELGQWIPNSHPVWGEEDPPRVASSETQLKYSSVIAKLNSTGITEEELTEWFKVFWNG